MNSLHRFAISATQSNNTSPQWGRGRERAGEGGLGLVPACSEGAAEPRTEQTASGVSCRRLAGHRPLPAPRHRIDSAI